MKLPVVRPANTSDLSSFISFAEESGCGITSLPCNPVVLEKKLHASKDSFQHKLIAPMHETYLFCLELEGKVIGTSGVVSRIGMQEPFFAYHLLNEHLTSSYLGIDRTVPVLHFTRARKKPTEIGTLYLAKNFRHKELGQPLGKLLSFSRFLFIATFKNRFASTVIAELRGVNQNGYSPFWEAVGRFFFKMDFAEADYLRTEQSLCIEELTPKHPLYVELLPREAQEAIGKTHHDAVGAKKLLEKQGFKMSHYVDLFDAGPHVYAHTEEIHAVKESQEGVVKELHSETRDSPLAIIANTRLDYRATCAPLLVENNRVTFHAAVASALQIRVGDLVRYYFL